MVNRQAVARVVKFLVGMIVTAVFAVGVPALLWHLVGNPLPSRLPTEEDLKYFIETGDLAPATIRKAMACVVWVCWGVFMLTLVVDAVAAIRGRERPRLPGGPFGGLAAALVTGLGLSVAGASGAAGGRGATGPANPRAEVPAVIASVPMAFVSAAEDGDEPARGNSGQAEGAPGIEASAVDLEEYVVSPRDNLWDLAEARFGDGRRWREIFEANVGRPQADGGVLERPDQYLQVGWTLLLPPPARAGTPAPGAAGTDGPVVVVEPGDTLSGIAAQHLGDASRYPAVFALNEGDPQEDGRTLEDEDLILPGWRLELPTEAGPEPVPEKESPPDVSPPDDAREEEYAALDAELERLRELLADAEASIAAGEEELGTVPPGSRSPETQPATRPNESAPAPSQNASGRETPPHVESQPPAGADEDDAGHAVPTLLGIAGAGLAVGIRRAVTTRRRRRALHLAPGAAPPRPPTALDDVRRDVALARDDARVRLLHVALDELAVHLSTERASVSRPRVVQVSPGRVEVLLTEGLSQGPPGWVSEGAGLVWVREGDGDGGDVGAEPRVCAPALVALGRPESGAQAYLNLEADSLVAVTGDPQVTREFVASIVAEVAHPPLGDRPAVVVVGDADASVAHFDGVRTAATWDEVAPDVVAWARQSEAVVTERGFAHPFVARAVAGDDDALAPLFVVCDHRPAAESFDEFVAVLARGHTAVALVVTGDDLADATRIVAGDGNLYVADLGLTCRAQRLSPEGARHLLALLDDAEGGAESGASGPEGDAAVARLGVVGPEAAAEGSGEPYEDPPYSVLVRVLGDVAVLGGARPLTAKQTAAVAYVALHAPVSPERVEEAVWPLQTTSRRKRLVNAISACRAALGATHLPLASDGRYTTGPDVRTDIELFGARLAAAASRASQEAMPILAGALELVDGVVFRYPARERASYVWVELENLISTWEWKVAEAALSLAEMCLAAGDTDGAIWAACAGLATSPTHTGLTEALMRAHWLGGDRPAAESVYRSHVAALEALDIDDVADSTVRLRDELRGGRVPAAAAAS